MAKKFHINDDNKVKPCTAKKGGCKFSFLNHFDNEVDANKKAEQLMEDKHGAINSLQKFKKSSVKNNRAYNIYKKIRGLNRGGSTREYSQGSYFNNAVKSASTQLKISMDEARDKIYEGYAKENEITVKQAEEHFNKLKQYRIEKDTEAREIRDFYKNNITNSLMEKYQEKYGEMQDHEDFEKYREWRDEYVYNELQKIRESASDENHNNIRRISQESIDKFDDKLSDLTSSAIGFEQHQYVNENKETINYDVVTFNDESDLNYNIYKKDGQYFYKLDYYMKSEDRYKPLTAKELSPDELFRNSEEYLTESQNAKISYYEDGNDEDEIYVKDFTNKHFSEASEILKKRYNIE